jgi:hypothetical protein
MAYSMRAPGVGIISLVATGTILDGSPVVATVATANGANADGCAAAAGTVADGVILGLAVKDGGGSFTAGQGVNVAIDGVYPATAAGTITAGQKVVASTTAGSVAAWTPALSHLPIIGVALEGAASGEKVAVLIAMGLSPLSVVVPYTQGASNITANTIVAVGAADNVVAPAGNAPTTGILGVALNTTTGAGQTVWVCISGPCQVASGAASSRGVSLTSNASAQAITAAPSAGTNAAAVGIGLAAGAGSAALFNVQVSPHVFQG